MPDLEIKIDRHIWTGECQVTVNGQQDRIVPALLMKSADLACLSTADWWDFGRNTFEEVLPKPSQSRNCWDEHITKTLSGAGTLIGKIKVGADPLPFEWLWESMVGYVSRSQGFTEWYPMGRHPGPIDLVRSLNAGSFSDIHAGPRDDISWRLGIVKVESDNRIVQAVDLLESFLRSTSPVSLARLDLVNLPPYDGTNELQISAALVNGSANIVEIIAHGNECDPASISTRSGQQPWSRLGKFLGQIASIKVVILSWCHSDCFIKNVISPALALCTSGVPAVIAWHPKPQLYSLAPFHRGFYGGLLAGAHVARASSLGRAAIFHSSNQGDPGKWLDACGPRLYVRSDASLSALRLPPRLPTR